MITITKATPSDYTGFATVENEVSKLHSDKVPWNFQKTVWNSFSFEYFSELISKEWTLFLLAKENHTIVWYAIAYTKEAENISILKPRKWMFLMSFWVKEVHKKRGIGSLLLERLELESRKAWYDSIELSVWSFNEEAIEFYKKRWFTEFSIKMRKTL